MESIIAETVSKIVGTRNAWHLDEDQRREDHRRPVTECKVLLEIKGDEQNGYHLIITPEGFFTADHWYRTQQDAMSNAEELFGIVAKDWMPNRSSD